MKDVISRNKINDIMILDSIKNISKYENLNIDLKSIVEFIDRVESENLEKCFPKEKNEEK